MAAGQPALPSGRFGAPGRRAGGGAWMRRAALGRAPAAVLAGVVAGMVVAAAVLAGLVLAGALPAPGWLPSWAALPGSGAVEAPPGEVCVVAPSLPYDPASGRPPLAARVVPPEARCPVCGMYPARYPRWAAQVIYRDGEAHFFDSPLSYFLFLQAVERHARGRSAADIAARYVTDHGEGGWIDPARAHFVHGSGASGPMRAGNLPAFARREAAEAFAARHGGRVIVAADVYTALLRTLDTRAAHDH